MMKDKKVSVPNTLQSKMTLSYMRFFATLLITNFHIAPLYPDSMKMLSTGGALGNSLFFFCSGYALYLSNKENGAYSWIARRYTRIYPSIWIFVAICIIGGMQSFSIQDFIIPPYWFLQAILFFYILFYFTTKYLAKHLIKTCVFFVSLFIITYFCVDHNTFIIENTENNHFLHWYFYYVIMIIGAIVARDSSFIIKIKPWVGIIALITLIILYYSMKISVMHIINPKYNLQLIIPIFLFIIPVFSFQLCSMTLISTPKYINKIVSFISDLTLDIYIVQFVIIGYFVKYDFPYGFMLSIISIIITAYLLNIGASYITKYLRVILIKK